LIKFGSFAKESVIRENTRGRDSALGRVEPLGLGVPPAVPSPCDHRLGGAIFFLRDLEGVEPEVALDDFFAPEESGAFAWLGESLAPPALGGLGALGTAFIASGLKGTSILGAPSTPCASFAKESG
jgi:hypothetical protein